MPGGRLVDEHDLGPADDRHRQAEPLLLAAGEPPVRRAPAVAEPEPLGQQRRGRAGGRAARAMCRSISIARTPLQAPPPCSITPMRGSRSRRSRTGSRPSTRTRPACGRAVALAGLQGRGLAGAVGAEHGGDRCRARRSARARRRRPCRRTASPGRRPRRRDAGAGTRSAGRRARDTHHGVSERRPTTSHVGRRPATDSSGSVSTVGCRHPPAGRTPPAARATASDAVRPAAGSRATPARACTACRCADPEVAERVDDGVLHGRGRADRARTRRCPWRPAG